MKHLATVCCCVALCFSFTLTARVLGGDRPTGRQFATRSEVIARHGMAATSQPAMTAVARLS